MDFLNRDNLYLCLDQGGHASRALVFNQQGDLETTAFKEITARHTPEGYVEYDADKLLASIKFVLQHVLEQLGGKCRHIKAAGLATQRSNVVCWDKNSGQALSPIISWQDRRGALQVKQLAAQAKHIHVKTGLFLSPHYGASKLRWCMDHLPAVNQAFQEQRLGFGPMASYLTHHLVQERPFVADMVNGSRTQLVNLETGEWDDELLDLFDLPRDPLPRNVATRYEFGHLHDAPHVPLQYVTGDQAAALYAYGKLQPDTVYINMGTGAFISRPSGGAHILGRRLLTSVTRQQADKTEFVLEGTVNGAGSALEWYASETNLPDLFEKLPGWLDESNNHDTLFLNGISGLGAPFWLADFPSSFTGSTEIIPRAVAVAESIIFLIQASLDELQKLASPPEQIQLTGGLAQMDGLCQRLANLSGLPVYRPLECEATGRGLAYLLADCPRHWPETKPGEWFQPEDAVELKNAYNKWLDSMLAVMRES